MDSLCGQLLIASPRLMDPPFHQTVVLMVNHDAEGALGLTLNRPTPLALADIWQQVSTEPCQFSGLLHSGGPCEGMMMALHTYPQAAEETVLEGLYVTTERPKLEWLMAQPENDTPTLRFFAGYAGWAPEQLEGELREGAWLLLPATSQVVFTEPATLWSDMLARVDPTFTRIALNPVLQPPDPCAN